MAARGRGVPDAAVPSGAGVSAEDLMAVVRVHADRLHDGVRRLGCDAAAAVEVVEESALDLLDAVVARPQTVEDAVGWWFARARALGRKVVTRTAELPLGGGVLADDEDQLVLAEALDQLPESARWALLLRDSYDLPAASVAAALGTDQDSALELVARARLEFLPLVDDEPAPPLPAHQASLASLARIAEGGPVAAPDATARRHALSCEACSALTDGLQRSHLLLTGLTVAALPPDERAAVLERVEDAAFAALPTAASLEAAQQAWLLEADEDDVPPRLFSPFLVLMSLVLSVLLGVGAGLLLSRTGGVGALVGGGGTAPDDVVLLVPPSPVPEVLVSPPPVLQPLPQTTVFLVPPPQPSPPPPAPRPSPTAGPPAVAVDPDAGPDGATLQVFGTGWTPGASVLVEYVDPTGLPTGSQTTVTVGPGGSFSGTLVAEDPNDLPGEHVVRASDGEVQAETTYDASG